MLSRGLAVNCQPPAPSVTTPLICCQALSALLLVERLKQPEPECSQMCVSPGGWSQLGDEKRAVLGAGGVYGLEKVLMLVLHNSKSARSQVKDFSSWAPFSLLVLGGASGASPARAAPQPGSR